VARSDSPTSSLRFMLRIEAATCVESVRISLGWRSKPSHLHFSRSRSSNIVSAWPSISRSRKRDSMEKLKPGSLSSSPRSYFQSIRARTASAASRSDKRSANWRMVITASRQGAAAGCPLAGKSGAKSASSNMLPDDVAAPCRYFPSGMASLATRIVSAGTKATGCAWSIFFRRGDPPDARCLSLRLH
jgi:hypothetical protein